MNSLIQQPFPHWFQRQQRILQRRKEGKIEEEKISISTWWTHVDGEYFPSWMSKNCNALIYNMGFVQTEEDEKVLF